MSLWLGLVLMAAQQSPVETQLTFEGAGKLKLFGTMTMPSHAPGQAVPAVLLLPGSGPTDRNGNQPPALVTDVLKQIAEELAKNGIASFRFDKRATRMYQPSFPKDRTQWPDFFKWENFVDDATAAYKFLGKQSMVDPKRVAILGHSEGAEIALQIGSNLAQTEPPAAIITIGGAGRPMGPILTEQINRALDKQKLPAPVKKQYTDGLAKILDQIVKEGTYPTDMPPGLNTLFNESTTKIMRSYCTIDPADLAKNYPGPVLLINGAKDTQVSAERDTPKLKAALESRKTGTVETFIVPDASHCLKSTAAGNEDAMTGPIIPAALDRIKEFVRKELHP